MATQAQRTELLTLLVGMFDAAPTAELLTQLEAGLDAGATVDQYAATIAQSSTFATVYPTTEDFVANFATNLLGSNVSAEVLAVANGYVAGQIEAGESVDDIIQSALNALGNIEETNETWGAAAAALNNKVEVATYFVENVTGTGYSTLAEMKQILANVTNDDATVTAAKAEADVLAAPAQTFTLTTGTDAGAAFTGAEKDDTFNADLLTLNATDVLDGGAGTDTLNAEINSAITNAFTISNIENINLTALGNQNVALDKITGVTTLTTKGSTGSLTVSKATAAMGFGFEGSSTNSITATYVAGQLSGSSDTLNVDLNTAAGVALTVDAGFETAAINVNGTSDINTFTAPGVSTVTIAGSGNLDVADGLLDGVTTISATSYTGNLTTGTVNATTGFVDGAQQGAATGTSILLGSGDDKIGFDGASTSGSNTIKLGAGNDTLVLGGTAGSVNYVFGEAGDDKVDATVVLDASDLIDLGEGTDTLSLATGTNTLVLRGVENLVVDGTAETSVTINSADTALAVSVETDADVNDDVTLANLTAGSTVTINDNTAKTGSVDALTVGYKSTEAAATIDVNSAVVDGDTDSITVTKVTDLTLDFAKAVDLGTGDLSVDDTVNLTVVAAKALDLNGIGSATTDALKTVTITGSDAVTTGAIANSDKLETLTVTAADTKDLSVGNILAAKELDTVTLSGKSVSLGDLGTSTAIDELTALTATAKDGNITLTASADGADAIDAKAVGTINLTAEKGSIFVADGTTDASLVAAADSTGITVNMTAKTKIGGHTDGASVATVTNTGGNITAALAGTADAIVNYTAVTSGVVSLTSTTTGSVNTTITNAGTAGAGETSTITLGNATSSDANEVTIKGTVDTLNFTGGTGADTLDFDATNVIAGGTISMGTGTDTVDFTNFASTGANKAAYDGLVINLGSSTLTITNGTATSSVTAGKVAQFDTDAASNTAKVDSVGTTFTLSGVEKVVGTDSADYIVANATGTTITGGAGNDTIVLGAGVDTVVFADTAANNGTDTVTGFTAGSDKINLSAFETVGTLVDGTGAYTVAGGQVVYLFGQSAGAADSSAAAITALNAAGTVTDAAATNWVVISDDNSTAVYQFANDNGGDEYTGATATLVGTLDVALSSASDIVIA